MFYTHFPKTKTNYNRSTIILIFIIIQIFSPPNQPKLVQNNQILENSVVTPKHAQENIIQLKYELSYEITYRTGNMIKDSLDLSLLITGNNLFYENGTIKYYLNKNVTNPQILQAFSLIFDPNYVSYIENHSSEEYIMNFFSNRREASENNEEAFQNGYYTLFWLNHTSTGNLAGPLNIPFLEVNDSINLVMQKELKTIAENSWSNAEDDLEKNVRLIDAFYILQNINIGEKYYLKMYYDEKFGSLLGLTAYGETEELSSYNIQIDLVETTLDLDFQDFNPYWEARLQTILTYVIVIGICVSLILFNILKKRNQEKKHHELLDNIT